MSSWFHTVLGKYDISHGWVGLDYSKLFLDPLQAELTLSHEMVHSVIAMTTDYGQATKVILTLIDDFTHLNDDEKDEIGTLFANSQRTVQEGFATLMELSRLRKLTNKNYALDWAKTHFPDEYLEWFGKLKFAFDLSQQYRDFFIEKISHLVMQTGIRKTMQQENLLSEPEKLKHYLSQVDNNPDLRLEKVIETLRYKSWLVTKQIPEIAAACGIRYFEPATKAEVAEFLTYATSFTNNPRKFSQQDIGDSPKGVEAFNQAAQNMIIANMNFNLAESAITLFDMKDFLFHSDKMEILFVNPNDSKWKHRATVKAISGTEPEVSLAGFYKTGEKYITVTSKENAVELLNNQLKSITMMVKWGGYDIVSDRLIWSDTARLPDVVVYNTVQEMMLGFQVLLEKRPDVKFHHLHAGAGEDHPLQTLIAKIDDRVPIHIVNTFGNRSISELLQIIKPHSSVFSNDELRSQKRHLNNILSLWMGLHWEVDWIETMIDKENLVKRQ